MIPSFLSTFEPVITQTYHGDITIIPPFNWRNYLYLFSTPSTEFITGCIHVAERVTWPSNLNLNPDIFLEIGLLENHLSIELTLDKAYRQLYTHTKLHGLQPHNPVELSISEHM